MDILKIHLTATRVDNPAPSHHTMAKISIENSSGRLCVENCKGSPRSVHLFTVKDANTLGCGDVYHLSAKQAGRIFAISCSLNNPQLIFSASQLNDLPSFLEIGKKPSKVKAIDSPTGKHIITTEHKGRFKDDTIFIAIIGITLDEIKIFSVVDKLIKRGILETPKGTVFERNIVKAIMHYEDALKYITKVSYYVSFYEAFETAVNADKNRKDKDFDVAAESISTLSKAEIKELRLFNNRIKHALRNNKDVNKLKASESQFSQLVLNLKKAADSAILSRISITEE